MKALRWFVGGRQRPATELVVHVSSRSISHPGLATSAPRASKNRPWGDAVVTGHGTIDGRPVGEIGDAWLDAIASLPFEDHDNRLSQSPRVRRSTNSLHERSGRSWWIPPPGVRT